MPAELLASALAKLVNSKPYEVSTDWKFHFFNSWRPLTLKGGLKCDRGGKNERRQSDRQTDRRTDGQLKGSELKVFDKTV